MLRKTSAAFGVVGCLAALMLLGVGPAFAASDDIEVYDDFESADFENSMNGFSWGGANRTSIVRDDGYVVNNGSPIMTGPLPAREWESAPESEGRHALRFRYPAGEYQSEQRFSLGEPLPEIWLSFWLRVPINFTHPSSTPTNQKLLALWMDGYSQGGDGSTVWLGFHHAGNGSSTFAVTSTDGGYQSSNAYEGATSFISTPADRGRWMKLVVRAQAESSANAGDGSIDVWRRWEDESSFTQTHSVSGKRIRRPSSGPQGFAAGYLMGWANAAYAQDTEFLVDEFVVSTASLLDGADPVEPSAPMPPRDLAAEQ